MFLKYQKKLLFQQDFLVAVVWASFNPPQNEDKQERKGCRSMISRIFIKSIESSQLNQINWIKSIEKNQIIFIKWILPNQFYQNTLIKSILLYHNKFNIYYLILSNQYYFMGFIHINFILSVSFYLKNSSYTL